VSIRYFNGLIFLGSGETSVQEAEGLKRRLADGLKMLGGLQQPDHAESEEHFRQCMAAQLKAERELADVVRDLAAALLGREIDFGAELPYPSRNARLIDGKLVQPPPPPEPTAAQVEMRALASEADAAEVDLRGPGFKARMPTQADIDESLDSACQNAYDMRTWTAESIASDLWAFSSSVGDADIPEIMPFVQDGMRRHPNPDA
jgi:hypothetical protein